jgi:hypothetical protein
MSHMRNQPVDPEGVMKTQAFGREQCTPPPNRCIIETPLFTAVESTTENRVATDRRRRRFMEQKLQNDCELERVLITEYLLEIPGYSLTSAYRPASDVGGDFLHLIPLQGSATLVILGNDPCHPRFGMSTLPSGQG